jgi:hypothetical protein
MVTRIKDWLVSLVAGKYVKSAVRHGGAALGVFLGTLLAAAGLDPKEAGELATATTGSLEQVVIILIPYAIAQGLSWINAKKKD